MVAWLVAGDPLADGDAESLARHFLAQQIQVEIVPAVAGAAPQAELVRRLLATRPLSGRTVVSTRPREQAGELKSWLEEAGAEVVCWPTIAIQPVADMTVIDRAIAELDAHEWVIFTSANGVRWFFDRLRHLQKDLRSFGRARVAAIGPATAQALAGKGLRVDVVPEIYQAEGLLEALSDQDMKGQRVLIPRAEVARDILPETLVARGAQVQVLVVYRAVPPSLDGDAMAERLRQGGVDAVTFTSSSTVTQFCDLLNSPDPGLLLRQHGVVVACIGPVTGDTARKCGLEVQVQASSFTVPGLTEALCRHFSTA